MDVEEKIAMMMEELTPQLERINPTIRKYTQSTDLYDMGLFEAVKRDLIDIKVDLSHVHGEIRAYHTMYTEGRKTIKAEVMQFLIDGKVSVTAADKTVYNEQVYKDYMKILFRIEQVFQMVNSKYYLIDSTLSAVQQSIANARNIENK